MAIWLYYDPLIIAVQMCFFLYLNTIRTHCTSVIALSVNEWAKKMVRCFCLFTMRCELLRLYGTELFSFFVLGHGRLNKMHASNRENERSRQSVRQKGQLHRAHGFRVELPGSLLSPVGLCDNSFCSTAPTLFLQPLFACPHCILFFFWNFQQKHNDNEPEQQWFSIYSSFLVLSSLRTAQ